MTPWFSLGLRSISAIILFQTLFFKFSGAPESVFIFQTLGVEPWGRWAAGASELAVVFMILWPKTQILGALGAIGIMVGAIGSHLLILGIVVQDDGGLLFMLACTVLATSSASLFLDRGKIKVLIQETLRV